jgi:hypothetical protein
MGFFGTYVFDGTGWTAREDQEPPQLAPGSLWIDIHDSDITTVVYSPAGQGSGVAYLGFTPRSYFEDDQASDPTDVTSESAGLADWWAQRRPEISEAQRIAKQAELAGYLAEDLDDDVDDVSDDEEDDDVFVEEKTARFLTALDLPLPDDLSV